MSGWSIRTPRPSLQNNENESCELPNQGRRPNIQSSLDAETQGDRSGEAQSRVPFNIENAPSDNENDVLLQAHTAVAYGGRDEFGVGATTTIKGKPVIMENDEAPSSAVPYEEIDDANMRTTKRKPEMMENDEAPMTAMQMAALYEEMDDVTNNNNVNANRKETSAAALSVPAQAHTQAQPSINPRVTTEPRPFSTPETDDNPTNRDHPQSALGIRLPPQSMLTAPTETEQTAPDAPVFHEVEARLVEDGPEIPVYDAVRISVGANDAPQHWLKKYQKYLFMGLGLLIGAGTAAAIASWIVSRGIKNEGGEDGRDGPLNKNEVAGEKDERDGLFNPTYQPSQSFAPSLRPSNSLTPTLTPSFRSTFRPSHFQSSPPSSYWSSLVWKQQGKAKHGEESGDEFGWSTALSGNGMVMAIGARGYKINNGRSGYVKVYLREDEGWKQLGQTIYGEDDSDWFGTSVSLSMDGLTLAVGAPSNFGQVKVYGWDQSAFNYQQFGKNIDGERAGIRFSSSLALSSDGKTLAVGAPYTYSGSVKVYCWDEDASDYKQLGRTIFGEAGGDQFGFSVSFSSDSKTLAVGAVQRLNGGKPGYVKIYVWDESISNYKQQGNSIIGEAYGDLFGLSVVLSADAKVLAVGAPWGDPGGPQSGQVKAYGWDEAALEYEPRGQAIDGKEADDRLGESVALSADGKTMAIGAIHVNENGFHSGQVMVYIWEEDTLYYNLIGHAITGDAADDQAGRSVSLSVDGKTLVIGAPGNAENGDDSGKVKVFNVDY